MDKHPGFKEAVPFRLDRFTTSEGAVVVQWPSKMTTDDREDVFEWMELLKRMMRRCVVEIEVEQEALAAPSDAANAAERSE